MEKDDERTFSDNFVSQNENFQPQSSTESQSNFEPQISQSPSNQNNQFDRRISKSNKNDFFKVSSPITKEGIKNYTLYTIHTSLSNNKIYKRYSDFDALRSKLQERWPGIYIPNIPPKKIVGNLDSSVISMRCKLFDRFGDKISKVPYLFNSEEMKYFISSDDVEKALGKFPKETYDEILMKYKRTLLNFVREDSSNTEDNLSKCQSFMNKTLLKLSTSIKVTFLFRNSKKSYLFQMIRKKKK